MAACRLCWAAPRRSTCTPFSGSAHEVGSIPGRPAPMQAPLIEDSAAMGWAPPAGDRLGPRLPCARSRWSHHRFRGDRAPGVSQPEPPPPRSVPGAARSSTFPAREGSTGPSPVPGAASPTAPAPGPSPRLPGSESPWNLPTPHPGLGAPGPGLQGDPPHSAPTPHSPAETQGSARCSPLQLPLLLQVSLFTCRPSSPSAHGGGTHGPVCCARTTAWHLELLLSEGARERRCGRRGEDRCLAEPVSRWSVLPAGGDCRGQSVTRGKGNP